VNLSGREDPSTSILAKNDDLETAVPTQEEPTDFSDDELNEESFGGESEILDQ